MLDVFGKTFGDSVTVIFVQRKVSLRDRIILGLLLDARALFFVPRSRTGIDACCQMLFII